MSNHSEEKKPIYKKWWFWVIIVVVIIAIGGGASTQNNNSQQTSSAPATQTATETQSETANTPTESTANDKAEVTLAQYEQIKDGMTYDEVLSIFGGKEDSSSESEIAGIKSEIRTWNGKKAFSVATIGFTDGKVSSKSQTGLE